METSNEESHGPAENSHWKEAEAAESAFTLSGAHGWILLLGSISIYLLWKKFLEHRFSRYQEARRVAEESNHKNEELHLSRQRAMEESRLRLQEQMDAAAARHKEIQQQKEDAKRREKIQLYENMEKSRRTKTEETVDRGRGEKKQTEGRLRGEYNPLMGGSSGSCYRPSRRGGGSGGG